uniref:Variant surface glycoprotein 1125.4721 n=1 Tax=Trypanosoma brucei TaxID=5691 RepID=A0A1J0RAW0_9TRYP|nr:variant surface glycoprotein 1125.4721 [Trypanosoma brucei]
MASILSVWSILVTATVGEDSNVHEKAALCGLIELRANRALLTEEEDTTTGAINNIMDLNMSLSAESWQKLFREPSNPENFRDLPKGEFTENKDWPTKWPSWKAAAQRLKTGQAHETIQKKAGLQTADYATLKQAVAAAGNLADQAATLQQEITDIDSSGKLLKQQQLREALDKQIYGATTENEDAVEVATLLRTAHSGTRQSTCEDDTTTGKVTTVLAAMLCVCSKDHSPSGDEGKTCSGKTALSNAWDAASPPTATELGELINLCDTKAAVQLTSSELQTRINNSKKLLRRTSSGTYLGKIVGSNCDRKNNGGLCVKYTDITTGGGISFDKIPWLAGLQQLVNKLNESEHAYSIKRALVRKLKTVTKELDNIGNKARRSAAATALSTASETRPQKQEQDLKTQCEAHNKSKTACLGAKCAWIGQKDDDGPCTPTEAQVAEQQATQAGTGDETAGTDPN